MSQKQCLLSRSDLGLVSENDHKVGLCLCKYCTCGAHHCSSVSSRKHSVPSAFVTSYQAAYRGRSGEPGERHKLEEYTPNPHRMDLETTNQRDFKPFSVEKSLNVQQRSGTPSLQFAARSSYAAEFPNWGAVERPIEKTPRYPLRATEVKFHGTSTYQRNFKSPDTRPPSRAHSQTRATNLFGSCDSVEQTTVQRAFKPYSSSHMSTTVRRPKEEYVKVAASPMHFTSISRADFRPPTAQALDPHLVRKNISMYLS